MNVKEFARAGLQGPAAYRLAALVLGAVQGLLLYWVDKGAAFDDHKMVAEGLETFLVLAPISFVLLVRTDRVKETAIYALSLSAVLGAIEYFGRSRAGLEGYLARDFAFAFVVSGLWIAFAGATYFPTWRDSGKFPPPYAGLFTHAWNNLMILAVSAAFLGGGWLILLLWSELFKIIGIDFFNTLFFRKDWFGAAFTFATIGFGIAFVRELEKVVYAVRGLVLGLCAILAVALAAIGTGFVLALPFTGLQPLWGTGRAAVILMWVVVLVALGAVAVTREGADGEPPNPLVNWTMMAGLLAVSVLSLIALYALYLRIGQYGLTPDRVYAVTGVLGAAIFALPLGWGVLRYRQGWQQGLVKSKSLIGFGTIILALLVHVPPFEPYTLSAQNQLARLRDGKVAPNRFDFGYLHYQLGAPGQAALAEIRADEELMAREGMADALAILDTSESWWEWNNARPKEEYEPTLVAREELRKLGDYMRMYPANAQIPESGVDFLLDRRAAWLSGCTRQVEVARCMLLYVDIDRDGHRDMLSAGSNWVYSLDVILFDAANGGWKEGRNLVPEGGGGEDVSSAVDAGKVSVEAPDYGTLVIGEKKYR